MKPEISTTRSDSGIDMILVRHIDTLFIVHIYFTIKMVLQNIFCKYWKICIVYVQENYILTEVSV